MLSAGSRTAIRAATRNGELFVSPISFWEIATLVRKGRLDLKMLVADYLERIETSGVHLLALTPDIARAAGTFDDSIGGDTADRLLVATALSMNLRLMTRDRALLSLDRTLGLRVLAC
jgi:PIN domain nuclease of toxin-antitoxin system